MSRRGSASQWQIASSLFLGVCLGATAMFAGTTLLGQDDEDPTVLPHVQTTLTTVTVPELSAEPSTTTESPVSTESSVVIVPHQLFVSLDGIDSESRGRTAGQSLRTAEYAMTLVAQGDTVFFGPGVYEQLRISGKDDVHIVGDSDGQTVFTGEGLEGSAALQIDGSSNVTVTGVQAQDALWGVVVLNSTAVVLSDLSVHDVGQEGVLIRENSHDVEVANSVITRTGLRQGSNGEFLYSTFGEGIYLGTGGPMSDGSYDQTSDISLHDNEISFTTAEAIDVKTSVFHVSIADNIIHDIDTATSGAIVLGIGPRTYVDHQVFVERNVIYRVTCTSQWTDGNAIRISIPATVRDNIIWDTQHRGIYIDSDLRSEGPGSVVVQNNLIAQTSLVAIEDASRFEDSQVSVELADNRIGAEADALVPEFPAEPTAEFIAATFELLLAQTG